MSSFFQNNSNFNQPIITPVDVNLRDPVAEATEASNYAYTQINSARDSIRKKLEEQEAELENTTPNLANTLRNVEEKLRATDGMSATERNAQRLREATLTHTERLKGTSGQEILAQAQDRANGLSEEEVQRNAQNRKALQTMSDEQRVENAIRNKNGDPESTYDAELLNAIHNDDLLTLKRRFADKPLLLEYALEQRNENVANSLKLNEYYPTEVNSALAWDNLKASMASGLAETTGGIGYAWDRLTKSNQEMLEAQNDPDSLTNRLNQWASETQNRTGRLADEKSGAIRKLAEQQYDKAYNQANEEGKSEIAAQYEANIASLAYSVNQNLNNTLGLTKEMSEMIPDILMAFGTAGISALVTKGGIKLLSKEVGKELLKKTGQAGAKAEAVALKKGLGQTDTLALKNRAQKLAEETSSASAKLAKTEGLVNKSVKGAVFTEEAINTGLQNAVGSYQDASSAIMQMNPDILAQSEGGKKLKAEHPKWTNEQIQKELAGKAGTQAGDATFITTAIVGAIGAFPEARMAEKLFTQKPIKGSLKAVGKSTTINLSQEYFEEADSKENANIAVNTVTGYKADIKKGVREAGFVGVFSGAGSTLISNSPELISTGKDVIAKPIKNVVANQVQKQRNELDKKDNQAFNNAYNNIVNNNSDNPNNLSTGNNGNTKYSQSLSNVKDFYKKDAEAIKDENQKQSYLNSINSISDIQLISNIINASHQTAQRIKELNDKKSKGKLNQEDETELDNLTQLNEIYHNQLTSLRESLDEDLLESVQDKLTRAQEIKSNPDFASILSSGKSQEEIIAELNAKFPTEFKEWGEIEQHLNNLQNSTLYKSLQTATGKELLEQEALKAEDIDIVEQTGSIEDSVDNYAHTDTDGNVSFSNKISKKANQLKLDFEDNIQKIEKSAKLSNKEKKTLKARLAKEFVKKVRNIATSGNVDKTNVKNSWNGIYSLTSSLLEGLSYDGLLEPNEKNLIVDLISGLKDMAEKYSTGNYNEGLMLSAYGKFIGSATGVKSKDYSKERVGLLGYVQRALDNKGKLLPEDLVKLGQFSLTQQFKIEGLQQILNTPKGKKDTVLKNKLGFSYIKYDKPKRLFNASLGRNGLFTLTQDDFNLGGKKVEFRTSRDVENYLSILNEESELFERVLEKIRYTHYKKSKKVSGAAATKELSKERIKELDKEADGIVQANETIEKILEEQTFEQEDLPFFSNRVYNSPKERIDEVIEDSSLANALATSNFMENFLNSVPLKDNFNFTPQQWEGLSELSNFLQDSVTNKPRAFTLSGYAGTGKSTIIDYLFKYHNDLKPIYMTPTHAANLVLSDKTGQLPVTTQSAIIGKGYDAKFNSKIEAQLKDSKGKAVIVIDEASMLENDNAGDIVNLASQFGVPVIFMGDIAQLPPVGISKVSSVFNGKYPLYQLNNVKRTNDSQILDLVTQIRNQNTPDTLGKIPVKDNSENLHYFGSTEDFENKAIEAVANNSDDNIIITFFNKDVSRYNDEVRRFKYRYLGRSEDKTIPVQVDEKLIGYGGTDSKQPALGEIGNSIEYNVKSVVNGLGYTTVYLKIPETYQKIVQDNPQLVIDHYKDRNIYNRIIEDGLSTLYVLHLSLEDSIKDHLGSNEQNHEKAREFFFEKVSEKLNYLRKKNYHTQRTYGFNPSEYKDVRSLQATLNLFGLSANYQWALDKNGDITIEPASTSKSNDSRGNSEAQLFVDYLNRKAKLNKSIDFSYAITSYKSQGGTYKNVYADLYNLPKDNPITSDGKVIGSLVNSVLYTTLTRASNTLNILANPKNTYGQELPTKQPNWEAHNIWFSAGHNAILSNLYPVENGFYFNGIKFESVEHAYQALKNAPNMVNGVATIPNAVSIANNNELLEWIESTRDKFRNPENGIVKRKGISNTKTSKGTPYTIALMKHLLFARLKQDSQFYNALSQRRNIRSNLTHINPNKTEVANNDLWLDNGSVNIDGIQYSGQFSSILNSAVGVLHKIQFDSRDKQKFQIEHAFITNAEPSKKAYALKDAIKATKANRYILFGADGSSTARYRRELLNIVNPQTINNTNYNSKDTIFISVNGKRQDRVSIMNNDDKANLLRQNIDNAIKVKASFIIDTKADRDRDYNIGEREVAEYLISKGYAEVGGTGLFTYKGITQSAPKRVAFVKEGIEINQKTVNDYEGKVVFVVNKDSNLKGSNVIKIDLSSKATIDSTFENLKELNKDKHIFFPTNGLNTEGSNNADYLNKKLSTEFGLDNTFGKVNLNPNTANTRTKEDMVINGFENLTDAQIEDIYQQASELTPKFIKSHPKGNNPTNIFAMYSDSRNTFGNPKELPKDVIRTDENVKESVKDYIKWLFTSKEPLAKFQRKGLFNPAQFNENSVYTYNNPANLNSKRTTHIHILHWLVTSANSPVVKFRANNIDNSEVSSNKYFIKKGIIDDTNINYFESEEGNYVWQNLTGKAITEVIDRKNTPNFNEQNVFTQLRLKGLDVYKDSKGNYVTNNILNSGAIKISTKANVLTSYEVGELSDSTDRETLTNNAKFLAEQVKPDYTEEDIAYSSYFLYSYNKFIKSAEDFLLNSSPIVSLVSDKTTWFNLSGLFNFILVNKSENSKEKQVTFTKDFVHSIARSAIDSLLDPRPTPVGSRVREEYSDDGSSDVMLFDITDNPNKTFEKSKNEILSGTHLNALAGTDEDFGNLGTVKSDFVERLGESALKAMGIKVDRNHPDVTLYRGLVNAIGNEALTFLYNNNLVRITRLAKYPITSEPSVGNMTIVDHISFTHNWDKNTKKLIKDLTNSTKDNIQELYKKSLQQNALLANAAILKKFSDSPAGQFIFPEHTNNKGGVSYDKPFTVKDSDVAIKLGTGKSKELHQAIQAQNNIRWIPNNNTDGTGLATFLEPSNKSNRNWFKAFIGYTEVSENNIDAKNKSIESINAGIDRQFDILDDFMYGKDISPEKPVYLRHNLTSTQRIQNNSMLNIQSGKIIRDVLLPLNTDKDGKPLEYGFEIKDTNSTNLVDRAIELLNKPELRIIDGSINEYLNSEYHNVIGYTLAVAQALGVKIEKQSTLKSLNILKDLLNDDSIQELIQEIQKGMDGKPMDVDLINKFKSNPLYEDISTSRGFTALYTLAQLDSGKGLNSQDKFQPQLVIEADGIGNGVYNNLKQYVVKFSDAYLTSLKRTGNVLLDNIVQEEARGKTIDDIEGSKYLLTKEDPTDQLEDVYTVVSSELSSILKGIFDTFTNTSTLGEFLKSGDLNGFRAFAYKEKGTHMSQLKALETVYLLHLMNGLDNNDSPLNAPINKLEIAIKRAIAKSGVTPSNYGGQLDGITNQLTGDIKSSILNRINTLHNVVKTSKTWKEVLERYPNFNDELSFTHSISTYFGLLPPNVQIDLSSNRALLNYLNSYSKLNSSNIRKFNRSIKYSLGTFLYRAIHEVYGEQFSLISSIIALDQIQYTKFITEFHYKVSEKIKERNLQNNYIDVDGRVLNPRAIDYLSNDEIVEVLKSMITSPIVATAFSSDSRLVETLVHTGNTILKDIEHVSKEGMTTGIGLTSADIKSKGGEYNVPLNSVIKSAWLNYTIAGASLLTSSTVSTESKSMAEFQEQIGKEGLAVGQVFDGSEMMFALMGYLSDKLNNITDNVHNKTSLLENFYYKFVLSNVQSLDSIYLSSHNNFNVKSDLENINNSKISLTGIMKIISYISAVEFTLKAEDKNSNISVILKTDGVTFKQIAMRSYFQELLDSSLSSILNGEANFENIFDINLNELSKITNVESSLELKPILYEMLGVESFAYQAKREDTFETFKRMVAKNKAIKRMEKEYLIQITNQFGGTSSGSIRNRNNSKALALKERFTKFISDRGIENAHLKSSSELLEKFLALDPEFNETLKKYTREEYYKLPDPKESHTKKSLEVKAKNSNELKTEVNKFINDLSDESSEETTRDLTLLSSMVFHNSDNLPVTTNREEYAIRLKGQGQAFLNQEFVVGTYHPTAGIYINNDSSISSKEKLTTILHEMLHSKLNNFWTSYYKGKPLSTEQKSALSLMEEIAKDMTSRFIAVPELIQIRREMLKQAEIGFNVDFAYQNYEDTLMATMLNVATVFDPEFEKTNTPEEVAKARTEVMKEFYAYALTEKNMLIHMKNRKLVNRNDVLNKTGFRKVWEGFVKSLDKFFDSLKNLFGLKSKGDLSALEKTSYYADSLRALTILNINNENYSGYAPESNTSNRISTREAFNASVRTNNTTKHANYLSGLHNLVHTALETQITPNGSSNFEELHEQVKNNDLNQEAIDTLANLRTNGLWFSNAEEEMYKLMFATNKTMFEGANDVFNEVASKFITDLQNTINPTDFNKYFPNNYNNVFNGNINNTLALISTNEKLKNYVEDSLKKKSNTKLSEKFNTYILDKGLFKGLPNQFKNSSSLEKLAGISAMMDYRNKLSFIEQEKIKAENTKNHIQMIKAREFIRNNSKQLPSNLGSLMTVAGTFFFSGDGRVEENSALGDLLQELNDNNIALKGKSTLINEIFRWFRGAHKKVQYIYSSQNKLSIVSDSTREKISNVINEGILEKFSKLTDEQDKAISNILMKGMVYRMDLSNKTQAHMARALKDKSYRQSQLSLERNEAETLLSNLGYTDSEVSNIMDFLEWQTSGLADLLHNGKAKANNNTNSHFILPNTRAISSLNFLNQVSGIKELFYTNGNPTKNLEELKRIVDNIVAYKSMDYASQSDIDLLVDLYTNESKGMNHLHKELDRLDKTARAVNPDSMLGYDGYIHSKDNPYKQYKIVEKNPNQKEEIDRLRALGYEVKATLPRGEVVMHTNCSLIAGYTTGMISLTELSINGANPNSFLRNKSGNIESNLYGDRTRDAAKLIWEKGVKGNRSYYNSLSEDGYSNYSPMLNTKGSVSNRTITDIDTNLKSQLTERTETGYQAIGNLYARLTEEAIVEKQNKQNIDTLKRAYINDPNKRNYVEISPNSKDERIRNFYHSLPQSTKNHMGNSLYVNRVELDNILGYRQASLTDIFTGKSQLPEPVQKAFKAVLNMFIKDFAGANPAKVIKYVERGLKEVSSLSKDYILIRSIIIPAQNLLSNIIHLWTTGIPVNKIVPMIYEGYNEAKRYTNLQSEIVKLEHSLTIGLTQDEEIKVRARLKYLNQIKNSSPVKPLIDEGILTSISDLSKDTVKEDDEFSLLTNLSNKFGITKVKSGLPPLVKDAMILKGSRTHNGFSQLMDFGDFVAKYALYKHLTKSKDWTHNQAMAVIRDEFVNYSMNKGRTFDYLNNVGLTWFLSYKLAIQRIIFRNARRNTLRTLAVWSGSKALDKANIPVVSELTQTVPEQLLWFDYSGYQFEADNLIDGFKTHYLNALLNKIL